MPRVDEPADDPLVAIDGQPPNPRRLPAGCAFHPRCRYADEVCRRERPALAARAGGISVACHHPVREQHA
jgi:oligopeptide/dipeptide ABC transporter ATP-binding protein